MKHLVLGSRGQVGSYVVRELLARCEDVIEWDIVIDPEHMDLRVGSSRLMEAMKESDYVHYLASDVGGSKYLAAYQDSFEFISNNVAIMDNVFTALRLTKKPFYFTSSQMSTMNHSTYGNLKAVGEGYTKALGGLTIRFWNVYGVETDPEKAHVITDFLKMAVNDHKILCRTTGSEKRQFVYADDVARELVNYAMGDVIPPRNPFDVTSGVWVSVSEVAEAVAGVIGGVEIFYGTKFDEVQGQMNNPYDDPRDWIDTTNLFDGITEVAKEMGLIE